MDSITKALPVAAVEVKVASKVVATRPVSPTDECARFELPMEAGDASLQVMMLDANKQPITGAYDVYVRKI